MTKRTKVTLVGTALTACLLAVGMSWSALVGSKPLPPDRQKVGKMPLVGELTPLVELLQRMWKPVSHRRSPPVYVWHAQSGQELCDLFANGKVVFVPDFKRLPPPHRTAWWIFAADSALAQASDR